MRSLQAIILAAGGGTRMKSDLPKVLHLLCGRPMIAYALDLAAASGVKQPIVILGEQAEQIKPHLPKEAKVVIQKAPTGTGEAVLCAKRALGGLSGDVLILYADTPLLRRTTIQRLIEAHGKSDAALTMLTAHLADPSGYGRIVRDATGAIAGVVEEPEANAQQRAIREVNVGPIVAKTQPLFEMLGTVKPSAVKKEWYLTQAVALLAQQPGTKFQTTRVEEASESLGVNSRLDLIRALGIIRQRIVDSHIHNGVTILDSHTTYIDQGVSIGQDTVVYPGTVIESGVSIGKRCAIGPFARLRRGVAIGNDTRVGNFVELVRTKLGDRVHVNHVAYLGDTTVDDEANIGAGTITANYDGTAKHPTTIGKGAFIGCDTILIAPVKVGPGAVTGAGSVIPKEHDVPARGVVVGVPARQFEPSKDGRERVSEAPKAAPKPAAKKTSAAAKKKKTTKKPAKKSAAKKARPKKPTKRPKARVAAKTRKAPKRKPVRRALARSRR
ncbi:MAG: bifunctional N-acetylglucosamine-1-phosphate uridyltransferase/glucosamine-1-phosphate acetyltransferase [Candidatus Omnitrophica bacterium]|nr:bifunctional N-acetylglucosamine-1-phosphate uridyltransferase/glucosamine-1-phosphate acetyltransferase [Candidatus Omnitrophota bacterium]